MIGDILQPTHLLFILVVALLVLGPKRLPEVARSLGSGLRDFRSAISGEHHDEDTIDHRGPVDTHPAIEPTNRAEPTPTAEPTHTGQFELYDESGQRAPEAEHSYALAREAQPGEPSHPDGAEAAPAQSPPTEEHPPAGAVSEPGKGAPPDQT